MRLCWGRRLVLCDQLRGMILVTKLVFHKGCQLLRPNMSAR